MDIHWRNTQKPVRFLFLDARAFIGIFFFLLHARPWVLLLAFFIMIYFWFLERRGLAFAASLRALRCWLLGRRRPANSRRGRRHTVDYG